jgi:hypothetical protein
MAASFVKNSNNKFYLRLTGNTTKVNFAGVFEAGNWYYLYIARPAGDGDTITLGKEARERDYSLFASTNANPRPPGALLWGNSKFVGCFDSVGNVRTYTFSGSGLREYLVTGKNQNGTPYDYNASAGGLMCLGGELLNFSSNLYAYPGSGYISNPIPLKIKNAGVWKNSYNIYTKNNGVWKECITGWIKVDGTWQKFYQNYRNSSWINMVEGTDDAIDFGIQVIALD